MDEYWAAKEKQWDAKKLKMDIIAARLQARMSIKEASDELARRLGELNIYVHRKDLRHLLKETFGRYIATGATPDDAYKLAIDGIVAAYAVGANPIQKHTVRPIQRTIPLRLNTRVAASQMPHTPRIHFNISAPNFIPPSTIHNRLNPDAAEFIPTQTIPVVDQPLASNIVVGEDDRTRETLLETLRVSGSRLPGWLKNGQTRRRKRSRQTRRHR